MSESTMRSRLVLRCKDLDMKPIENKVAKGTPDVNYVEGWLELKWMRGWPPRGGPLLIPHYTNHQRLWLKRRWERGGRSFLVLQVKNEWLMFCGCDAMPVGTLTRDQLYDIALEHHGEGLRIEAFKSLITADLEYLNDQRRIRGICNSPLIKQFSLNQLGAQKRERRSTVSCKCPQDDDTLESLLNLGSDGSTTEE
jgi:hypothetical protein